MHDEPKPKRRSALRHALGGLALLFLLALGLVLLDQAGIIDWCSCVRQTWVRCLGREAMREKVQVGMTRDEVVWRIGPTHRPTYMYGCRVVPAGKPFRYQDQRDEYPEYGFDVVYERTSLDGSDTDWKVIAVEDRK